MSMIFFKFFRTIVNCSGSHALIGFSITYPFLICLYDSNKSIFSKLQLIHSSVHLTEIYLYYPRKKVIKMLERS